jgi:hypothetical protein
MINNLPDDEFIKILNADLSLKVNRDALYKEAFELIDQSQALLLGARLSHEVKQNEQ